MEEWWHVHESTAIYVYIDVVPGNRSFSWHTILRAFFVCLFGAISLNLQIYVMVVCNVCQSALAEEQGMPMNLPFHGLWMLL